MSGCYHQTMTVVLLCHEQAAGQCMTGIIKLAYLRGICILIWMEDCLQPLVVSFYLLLVNVKGLLLTACHTAVSTCKADALHRQ